MDLQTENSTLLGAVMLTAVVLIPVLSSIALKILLSAFGTGGSNIECEHDWQPQIRHPSHNVFLNVDRCSKCPAMREYLA
ncbi:MULTISPECIES: hypothetical protein [unclassified Burkholderia]|uniref:hypothetical protein n=1 Tax=unclassified Burkholderia TaxID=2613784 RepID=UPI002AB1F897|nr:MULTISPECIES: hypothetical protein [unclassified Burkholderia]